MSDSEASQTDWSMIAEVAQHDDPSARDALERLVRRYWPAVYAYIRSSGRDVHEAADLTQGFICDVVISRRLCDRADPQRGRFRALLLGSLKNYLREVHRRHRRAGAPPASRRRLAADPLTGQTPEEAFCYHWSATLVRAVLAGVQAACRRDGLEAHWTVFEHRVARPMLFNEPPADYRILVERLKLKDESQAANMMITVKRRFVRALHAEVGRTVLDPSHVEDELHELVRDLERSR